MNHASAPHRSNRSAATVSSRLRRLSAGVLSLLWLAGPVASLRSASAQPPPKPAGAAKDDKPKPEVLLTEDNEVRIGRENAEENDKHIRVVTDAAIVERVNRIGQEIAAVANSVPVPALYGSSQLKQFHYTFKVVDDKDVNAYSLPGGFIYVNKGLIDYVHSDDELAGVLAHEISHADHHHVMKVQHEQAKIQNILLPALAAVLLASSHANGEDLQKAWIAGSLYITAKTNSYGVEAEKDADHCGMLLLTHTHYNPAGLYSVMLRLAVDERNNSLGDLGIYRTHPPGDERAAAAKKLLEDLHLPINLSEVDPARLALVTPVKAVDGAPDIVELKLNGVLLCRVVGADGMTAVQRGQTISRTLAGMMDGQLQSFEIRPNREQTYVLVRGKPLLSSADALAQHKTVAALAKDFSDAIMQVNQKRQLASGL